MGCGVTRGENLHRQSRVARLLEEKLEKERTWQAKWSHTKVDRERYEFREGMKVQLFFEIIAAKNISLGLMVLRLDAISALVSGLF